MFRATNVPSYQCSELPMFRATNVPSYQCFELPMFRATNVPSYHCSKLPCNRATLQQVQEPRSEKQSARAEERETKCKNRRTRTEKQNLRSEIFGTKSLERKILKFFASWVAKLTRNPTFGISFCIAVKGKQVVLLWVHGSAALTKVFCRLLTHRSGQKPRFAIGKQLWKTSPYKFQRGRDSPSGSIYTR